MVFENPLTDTQDKNTSIQTHHYVSAKSLADALPGLRRTEEMKQTQLKREEKFP